ncbi:hypothetical protein D3C76_1344680 [compost metagenome]
MGSGVQRLLVDVLQTAAPQPQRGLRGGAPGAAQVVEAVAEHAVVVAHLDITGTGKLALVDLAHLAQANVDVVQLTDIEHGPFEELGQQTGVA